MKRSVEERSRGGQYWNQGEIDRRRREKDPEQSLKEDYRSRYERNRNYCHI